MCVASDESPELLANAFKALVTGHQKIIKGGQGPEAANNVQVCSATGAFRLLELCCAGFLRPGGPVAPMHMRLNPNNVSNQVHLHLHFCHIDDASDSSNAPTFWTWRTYRVYDW